MEAGHATEALPHMDRVLSIWRARLGDASSPSGTAYNNLGICPPPGWESGGVGTELSSVSGRLRGSFDSRCRRARPERAEQPSHRARRLWTLGRRRTDRAPGSGLADRGAERARRRCPRHYTLGTILLATERPADAVVAAPSANATASSQSRAIITRTQLKPSRQRPRVRPRGHRLDRSGSVPPGR